MSECKPYKSSEVKVSWGDIEFEGFSEASEIVLDKRKSPPWGYSFAPRTGNDITFNVFKAPNRFHRLMQKLCFGIHWEKNSE